MAEVAMESLVQFTGQMIAQLESCVKIFCKMNGSFAYDSKTSYRNIREENEHILSHDINVFYSNHIVRFTYYPHMPLSLSHSVLTCSVSFEKANVEPIFYPLSQIFGYMKIIPESALTIPMILTTDSMRECFDCLTSAVQEIHPSIEQLSCDESGKADFFKSEVATAVRLIKRDFPADESIGNFVDHAKEEWFPEWKKEHEQNGAQADEAEIRSDFERIFQRLTDELHSSVDGDKRKLLRFYYQQLLMRATHPAYEAYMVGNYALAVKKLRKFRNRSSYEDGLIEYMQKAKSSHIHVPASIYSNLTELYGSGVPKSSFKEALFVAPAMLLFGLPWLPVFLGLYFLFYYVENKDAVYLLGVLSNAPSVMLPSMLMGIMMIYFNSRIFYKLFFRKNHQKLMALENATNSQATHRFMKALAIILAIGSVIFLFLTVHQNIKMTQDGFYDNTDFWSIQGEFYPYSEIDRLYYRVETPNGYGDMISVPSYAILLKSGKVIDPIRLDSTDKEFINVFLSKNVSVDGP